MPIFRRFLAFVLAAALSLPAAADSVQPGDLAASLESLRSQIPSSLADCDAERAAWMREQTRRIHEQAQATAKFHVVHRPDLVFTGAAALSDCRQAADDLLRRVLELRTQFASIHDPNEQIEKVRSYLETMTALIDLAGRLNDHYAGMVRDAAFLADRFPDGFIRLADLLRQDQSGIATSVLAASLNNPIEDEPPQYRQVLLSFQRVLLAQLYLKGRPDVIPVLSDFLLRSQADPHWRLVAAETIRRIGLPQDAPPHLKDVEGETPSITAETMLGALRTLRPQLPAALHQRCDAMIAWASDRAQHGITEAGYHFDNTVLLPGDWVLLRNSSPYNNCTSLAPGLFTHVGVAAMHQAEDGRRRLIVVDVTERKRIIDGDNLDKDLRSAVHYAILRHEDPAVAAKMGEVAGTIVGNPMQFDLTFDTSKVLELKGQPLKGRTIVTYCAGLLLLCAQETGRPRSEFFPIAETPLGGNGVANFETLGLQFGRDLISPTGSLFAERMKVVAFGQPMFDPARKVEQRVYDHFAKAMQEKVLNPKTNSYQQLRLRMAELAEKQPLVREALAAANNVSAEMDLVAAAKAATVVETMDEIAFGASQAFEEAVEALAAGPAEALQAEGQSQEQIANILRLRQRHDAMWRRLVAGETSLRELRDALIDYYADQGCREMDHRFFGDEE